MSFEGFIKGVGRRFGLDVRAFNPSRSDAARLQKMLHNNHIDLVLDVGANVGNYARYLRAIGYGGRIVCFEPLAEAHAALFRLARADGLVEIAPRMALGDRDGEVVINVAANSESSSILEMLENHRRVAPESKYVGTEKVQLRRLDGVMGPLLRGAKSLFLKVDAQGYETNILNGALDLLPLIKGMQLELSLVPFYAGEPDYLEMIKNVERLGYTLRDLTANFADAETGQAYQFDGIFFKGEPT